MECIAHISLEVKRCCKGIPLYAVPLRSIEVRDKEAIYSLGCSITEHGKYTGVELLLPNIGLF